MSTMASAAAARGRRPPASVAAPATARSAASGRGRRLVHPHGDRLGSRRRRSRPRARRTGTRPFERAEALMAGPRGARPPARLVGVALYAPADVTRRPARGRGAWCAAAPARRAYRTILARRPAAAAGARSRQRTDGARSSGRAGNCRGRARAPTRGPRRRDGEPLKAADAGGRHAAWLARSRRRRTPPIYQGAQASALRDAPRCSAPPGPAGAPDGRRRPRSTRRGARVGAGRASPPRRLAPVATARGRAAARVDPSDGRRPARVDLRRRRGRRRAMSAPNASTCRSLCTVHRRDGRRPRPWIAGPPGDVPLPADQPVDAAADRQGGVRRGRRGGGARRPRQA